MQYLLSVRSCDVNIRSAI